MCFSVVPLDNPITFYSQFTVFHLPLIYKIALKFIDSEVSVAV